MLAFLSMSHCISFVRTWGCMPPHQGAWPLVGQILATPLQNTFNTIQAAWKHCGLQFSLFWTLNFQFYYERSLLAWLLLFFVPVSMYTKMLIYNTENTKHWKNRKIISPLLFHALKMTFEKNKVHLFLRHERKIKNQSFTFKAAMLNSIKIINSVNLCFEL